MAYFLIFTWDHVCLVSDVGFSDCCKLRARFSKVKLTRLLTNRASTKLWAKF